MIEKIKENYFVFLNERYRYEDELGSKKIATVPQQRRQKACWYFLTFTKRICKRTKLPLQLSPGSIQGIVFSQGMEVFLLAISSKDNTMIANEGGDGFLWLQGLRIDKLYFYLLTSGTGSHLVCYGRSACSSMAYLNMGDYKGWTRLSPPAAYPSIGEYEANEGSLQPRHHVYAIDYYCSVDQGYSIFIRSPLLEYPPQGWTTNP